MRGRGVLLLPLFALGLVCLPGLQSKSRPRPLYSSRFSESSLAGSRYGLAGRLLRVAVLIALSGVGGFAIPAHGAGTSYYINNQAGSNCSDGGDHTMAQPWCTFAPANRIRTFVAGDEILLARGGAWHEELSLAGRGSSREPITLGAYGTGAKPKILRNQAVDRYLRAADGRELLEHQRS